MPALEAQHCRGCLQRVGFSHVDKSLGMFCSRACAADYPVVSNNEFRDNAFDLLVSRGMPRISLQTYFGITRQRMHQIMARRRNDVARRQPA